MKTSRFEVTPPKEAYRYWPSGANCLIETEDFVERLIFSKQELKEWEKVVLEQLEKYLTQRELSLPDPTVKLRFLYGQGWNIPNTFEAIKYHMKWKQEWPPIRSLVPLIHPVLNSGGIYIHGRDNRYRPSLVIRPFKLSEFNYYLHLASAYFLLEFILDTMLIPGQIENWVLIIDMKNFPLSEALNQKKLISELFTHYPCRVGKIYIMNAGKTIPGLDRLIPQNTFFKVHFIENLVEMLSDFHPRQLEIRFGGSVPNLKTFWPPCNSGASFRAAGDSVQEFLSAHSSYKEYFPGGTKIYSDLSSLKASHAGEKESFISNNDFKDEIWQRLELVSASYSFLAMEHLKTQGDEEKKEKGERKPKNSDEMTVASSREPNKILKDETEIPFICNFCTSECRVI
jgi:hypothetical protein